MNQTHKMSLREGALGHWVVGHVLKRLNVEEMGISGAISRNKDKKMHIVASNDGEF